MLLCCIGLPQHMKYPHVAKCLLVGDIGYRLGLLHSFARKSKILSGFTHSAEPLLLRKSTVLTLFGTNKKPPYIGWFLIGGRYRIRTYHLNNVNVAL